MRSLLTSDFDGDEYLDAKDLDETLKMLTKGNLEPNERETVIDKVALY